MPAGDIGSFIDTLEFDTLYCREPYIIHVSGNIYAITYTDNDRDGLLKTVTIHTDGQIDNSVIDTLEFDPVNTYHSCIIHVSGDVFAIVYRGPDIDGFLKTVTIHTNGQIDNTVIDTLEFDPVFGQNPTIVHVSGDIFAIVYNGNGGDGFLKTVTIHTNGQIDNTVIDTLEFDPAQGFYPGITHVSGNIFAIVYQGPGAGNDEGMIVTVTINDNGQISDTLEDSYRFSTFFYRSSIIKISDTVVAIAFEGTGNKGYLNTFAIDVSGNISTIDNLEFSVTCTTPHIISVGGGIYAIVYKSATEEKSTIKTVTIHTDGQIDDSVIDSQVVSNWALYPRLIRVAANMCAVVYAGTTFDEYDGYLKTIEIEEGSVSAEAPTKIWHRVGINMRRF